MCSFLGCPEFAQGSTRCDEHTVIQDDKYRPSSSARGYDWRWRKERTKFLAQYPDCEVQFCPRPATDVDHIDNLGPLGPHGYDWNNLRALCHSHHSAKTAATTHQLRRSNDQQ